MTSFVFEPMDYDNTPSNELQSELEETKCELRYAECILGTIRRNSAEYESLKLDILWLRTHLDLLLKLTLPY